MRWLKRGFWMTAWGVWAWLGVGLTRELPRNLGPPVSSRPWGEGSPGKDISYVGFVGESDRFVVIHDSSHVGVCEAEIGKIVFKVQSPPGRDLLWQDYFCPRLSSLFAKCGPNGESGAFRLDLNSGLWHRVSQGSVANGAAHPSRPWVSLVEWGGRVVVIDWQTRKEVFEYKLAEGTDLHGQRAFFVGDEDLVVIPRRQPDSLAEGTPKVFLADVWRLGEPPSLERTLEGATIFNRPSFAAGRVAVSDPFWTSAIDVYDLERGHVLFANVPRSERPNAPPEPGPFWQPPTLSASGRRVFGSDPPTLFDADSGRVVWRPSPWMIALAERRADAILVIEEWGSLWKDWLPSLSYRTHAVRDLETGRLLHRVVPSAKILQPSNWNATRTLAVGNDGCVYRLPLPVNWALWTLCQSILALPLILLWLALLWRRKRRERRLPGAAKTA